MTTTKAVRPNSKLKEAIDFILERQPESERNMTSVAYLLDVSPQYLYRCLAAGGTSLWTAAIIENITGGKFKKGDLAPGARQKINQKMKVNQERQKTQAEKLANKKES